MAEIFFSFVFLSLLFILLLKSFFSMAVSYFLLVFFVSLTVSWKISGWLGVVIFLVFMGGILVVLFYLGMYGNYYKFSFFGGFVVFTVVLGGVEVVSSETNMSFGDNSKFLLKFFFFLVMGGVLFLSLVAVSKVSGSGKSLRRFY